MTDLPRAYPYWPDFMRDTYNERIAIMREANNIPPDAPTPPFIRGEAIRAAEREMELVNGRGK
jgi:hypothetical protein